MLKPMAENLLTLKPVGNGKEIRKALIFPIGNALENLEDMKHSGVNPCNRTMFFKFDYHEFDLSGKYDLIFDLFRDGGAILYQTKNAFVENVGSDTAKITVFEDVEIIS